jgi:hypothetical protein
MKEYVIVPQADLDRLEAARKKLCNKLAAASPVKWAGGYYNDITDPMWKLTHTKYQKTTGMADINSVLFMFDKDCDCASVDPVEVGIPDILNIGEPLCSECDTKFLLRNSCRVLELIKEE